jgi:RNA polymerase sigma factor (sigma-70 family)
MNTAPASEIPSDWDLLREYVTAGSEPAFSALMQRHLDLVYAVAFRHCSDRSLAEEVVSNVFSILARKANNLKKDIVVAGWLFNTARYAAANARSSQSRRRQREQQAIELGDCFAASPANSGEADVAKAWEIIAAHLDSAVAQLSKADQDAILLRFYENKSLRAVGVDLGISEEAARKRTARALEKLRKAMAARGAGCSSAALGMVIATSAVQAAPPGVAGTVAEKVASSVADASLSSEQLWPRMVRAFRERFLKYAAAAVLIGGCLYGGARFQRSAPAPREVFLRQVQAVQDGDGEGYAKTLYFNGAEEKEARPFLVDSVQLRFKLRTNLVQRFGPDAFSGSPFPAFMDLLDTNRVRATTQSIQGQQATLVLPWGSRLPFLQQNGEWKLDFFRLPGMPSAAQYRIRTAQRNQAIEAVTSEIGNGSYTNISQSYRALQQKLKDGRVL